MEILYITLLTVFAAGAGTLTGFGISTLMVPVVLFFFPLAETLLLVGVIHWFGDIWKITLFKEGVRWRLIAAFGIPGVAATILGARIVISVSPALLSQILGGFFVVYTAFLFFKPRFQFRQKNFSAATGGTLSGFFAGIFGVGGAIRSAFLSVFDLPKAVYIATAGAIGLATDSARLAAYFWNGTRLGPLLLWGLFLFIPASFFGAFVAKRISDKIPQKKFRTVIAGFLLLVGIKFLLFP